MDKKCVCKTCKKHCECEIHDAYGYQNNGCNYGEHPINYCTEKENIYQEFR